MYFPLAVLVSVLGLVKLGNLNFSVNKPWLFGALSVKVCNHSLYYFIVITCQILRTLCKVPEQYIFISIFCFNIYVFAVKNLF